MSASGGSKAIIAAFTANLGIAIAKFVGFAVTGSTAMLAESVHSVADTGNQALLLLGGRRATKEADTAHPFGYGRERYFWSFVVALVLFSLGSLFAIYEGVHKLQHPEAPESAIIAFIILGVAVVLEGWSFRTAVLESQGLKGATSWFRFIRSSKNPELPVVLLEDFGALAGLLMALISLTLTVTVDPIWDGIGTVAIGVLLGCIAVVLAIEMKSLLIGEGASDEDVERITEALESAPHINTVIHLRTEHIGPEEILLAAKVGMDPALSLSHLAAAINEAEAAVRAAVPACRLIYLEPDVHVVR